MSFSGYEAPRTEQIPVALPNGTIIKVEVTQTGREDVAFDTKPFQQVTDAIEGVIIAVAGTLQRARPDKASIKFGVDVGIDAGQLTALLVKGNTKANLEISLEWQREQPK